MKLTLLKIINMKHCSRNVVCYVIDPLSVLSYVGLRLTAVGGGTALRFLPERHIWCAGWRVAKIQELEQSQKPDVPEGKRVDGVDPEVGIKSIEDLIKSDPNCSPEAKAFFSQNLFFFWGPEVKGRLMPPPP